MLRSHHGDCISVNKRSPVGLSHPAGLLYSGFPSIVLRFTLKTINYKEATEKTRQNARK